MPNRYRFLVALAALLGLSAPIAAQQPGTAADRAAQPSVMRYDPPAAPLLTLDPADRLEAAQAEASLATAAQRRSSSTTLMIVGGAAIVLGAVIGGDGGDVLVIGGAVVGLIGLYQYLR